MHAILNAFKKPEIKAIALLSIVLVSAMIIVLSSHNVNYYPQTLDTGYKITLPSSNSVSIELQNAVVFNLKPDPSISNMSMLPLMGDNTIIIFRPYNNESLAIGDIIQFDTHHSQDFLHQIVGISGECYQTKGINNKIGDYIGEYYGCVKKADIKYTVIGVLFTKSYDKFSG